MGQLSTRRFQVAVFQLIFEQWQCRNGFFNFELSDFSELSVNQLLDQLKAPEDWVRLYAKLELKTRPKEAVVKTISKWHETIKNQLKSPKRGGRAPHL